MKDLDYDVWFTHFWFFMYSVAHCYPDFPNDIIKRKYYDFILNIPMLIPNSKIQKLFTRMLDGFPVTPYLGNRDSFTYWLHFIQNKIDHELKNEQKSYHQHLDSYYNEYKATPIILSEKLGIKKKYIVFGLFTILGVFIFLQTK